MITLLRDGNYSLQETKDQTKILILDGQETFAWVDVPSIGEILITSHKVHDTDTLLATGRYRLYQVKKEPELVDLQHLELEVGEGKWQGYLLLTGLPTDKDKRNRIVPTDEVIANMQ